MSGGLAGHASIIAILAEISSTNVGFGQVMKI
jgi:hypothetical protein